MSACPKCDAVSPDAEARGACPRCGLRTDLWASFDPSPPPHPELDAAFEALRARWDEEAAHDALLGRAHALGALDAAAARYRAVLRRGPESDHAQARRALAQLVVYIAEVERARPREPVQLLTWARYVQVLLALGLCALASLFIWHAFRR